MNDERMILPPPSSLPAWTMPRRSGREPRATAVAGLVREAVAARQAFDHQGFLAALHGLRRSPVIRSAGTLADLASRAYGVDAIQVVASLAGRWVHVARPGSAERQRVAQALLSKIRPPSVDATTLACLLVLQPSASLWELLAERMSEPPFLVFDLVRVELARRPGEMRMTLARAAQDGASLSSAVGHHERAWMWWEAARKVAWSDKCGCGECLRPLDGGDCSPSV